MYKDPDKQREANKKASQRRRDKVNKVMGMTDVEIMQGMTEPSSSSRVIPKNEIISDADYARITGGSEVVMPKPERTVQGNIRVSKPGDPDYEPQCETTRAFVEDRPKRPEVGKRGKDIKVFADLPPDVQVIINSMSGVIDPKGKADRTEAAIMYQHLFPDRYYSAGVA